MTLRFSDAATSTLASSVTTTSTTIILDSVASFPQNMIVGDYFICTIANPENTVRETVKVTAIDYNAKTFTVQRGYDNTIAIAWTIGSKIEIRGGSSLFKEIMLATMEATRELIYPIGSIYTNATNSANPSSLLGFGTWTPFGVGRMLVGQDVNDTSFNSLEEIGGTKNSIVVEHSHSVSGSASAVGNHQHIIGIQGGNGSVNSANSLVGDPGQRQLGARYTEGAGAHDHSISGTAATTGSSGTNANLPPYITVKMWKRTA